MTNEDKLLNACFGFICGAVFVGFPSLLFFVPLGINPAFWFAFTILLCGPVGAWLAWTRAEDIESWLRRS